MSVFFFKNFCKRRFFFLSLEAIAEGQGAHEDFTTVKAKAPNSKHAQKKG
jgi:hypothetical protein